MRRMTLHDFLITSKISVRELARRCSTSASTIVRLRDFKTIPSRRVIDAVHRETGGQVGIDEMIKLAPRSEATGSTPAITSTKRDVTSPSAGGDRDRSMEGY